MGERHDSIFVSYRRDDSKHAAGRLVDRLASRFGAENLFLDVDSITLGRDFVDVLTSQVAKCEVMLVVIGPDWLTITDEQGNRRLDTPTDFVRIEVETALGRDIHVIPILVDGALPVTEKDLPETLTPLARRQAIRIDHESFIPDAERLADALEQIVAPASDKATDPRPQGKPTGKDVPYGVADAAPTPSELHENAAAYFGTGDGSTGGQTYQGSGDGRSNRYGWLVAASPILLAVLETAVLLLVGSAPNRMDLGTMRGEWVFFHVPALMALGLVLLRMVTGRMTSGQLVLFGLGVAALYTFAMIVNS